MSFWLTLITLYVFLSILSVGTCGTITVHPLSTTATLYTPVDFTCEGHGGGLVWTIKGNNITDTVEHERAISIITTNTSNGNKSVLTIVALPVNDGINILCNIGTDIFNIAQSPALLTIRGISPVENVSLYLNSSMLCWSPPSSIPSQYQPLLSYIVNITIGTNGPVAYTTNKTSLLLPSLTCNINTTITVTSNGYSSNSTNNIINVHSTYNKTDVSTPVMTYDGTNNTFDATFTITVVGYVCDNTTVTGVINNNKDQKRNDPIYIDGIGKSTTLKYSLFNLKQFEIWTFCTFIIDPICNINDKSDLVPFTTYHVQDVSVYQVDDDSVRVECTFVYQSIADGCHIKLTADGSIIQSFDISLNINESNIASQNRTLSVIGIYSITAYDIVNGITTDTPSVQYDGIFQYMSLMDSVTTSDITTTPTSTTTSYTQLHITSQLVPSNTHPSIDTTNSADVIPVIVGSVAGGVFIILIVIIISIIVIGSCVIITKRNNKKKRRVQLNAERAIVRLPHSNNNQYSEVVLPSITIQPSSVVYTSNDDNPYHLPINEFIPNGRGLHGDASPYHNYRHDFIINGSGLADTIDSSGQQQHNESSSLPCDNEGGVVSTTTNGNYVEQESSFIGASGESNDLLLLSSPNKSNDSASVVTSSLGSPHNKDLVNKQAE